MAFGTPDVRVVELSVKAFRNYVLILRHEESAALILILTRSQTFFK